MSEKNNYCLAMYDVRGKQNYIFRNNHLKEIVGASAIIRDVFSDYLCECAKQYRKNKLSIDDNSTAIFNLNNKEEKQEMKEFNSDKFIDHMKDDKYVGELIYDGGGNFLLLYKNKEIAEDITYLFTKKVIEETETLKVICTYIENVNFDDFKGDREKLYAKHELISSINNYEVPSRVLPIIQVDNVTSLPLTNTLIYEQEKVTYESYAKYKKYYELVKEEGKDSENGHLVKGEKFLDKLVENKGKESLLAVVFIDGNNMGQKVQECLKDKKTYDDCIKELRRFSNEIQDVFIDKGIKEINSKLDEKYNKKNKNESYKKERRLVVFAADEINFILNARDAYDAVKAYFSAIKKAGNNHSACAGISIFHSHAPYSDAYRIAEECCESAKARMKELKVDNAFYIDFQYNQGVIGLDLDLIRKKDDPNYEDIQKRLCSKPWLDLDSKSEITTTLVDQMVEELNKISRTNIKTLTQAAKHSQNEFDMEVQRIVAHSENKPDFSLNNVLTKQTQRKLIYDIGIVYDLWFVKKIGNKKQNKEGENNES